MSDSKNVYADAIDIRNADVYVEGNLILKNINWQLSKGEHCFVLGPNGAGKTTLIKTLLGHLWPRYGADVSILGCRFGVGNLAEARKKIAWISPFLLTWAGPQWTAIELVVSGKDATMGAYRKYSAAEKKQALNALERLNAGHLAERHFEQMSSGEQVKVLIARALISHPELLILDEACVHLDLKSRDYLLSAVEKLARSKDSPTIIFITHRIDDISTVFESGVVLKAGQIIFQGKRDEVLTEKNLSDTFEIALKLMKTPDGRYWPFTAH